MTMRERFLGIASALAVLVTVQQFLLGLYIHTPSANDTQRFLRDSTTSVAQLVESNVPNKRSESAVASAKATQRTLLFITTVFSDRHADFLSCCWPRLMGSSDFLRSVDVMVFSNNETEIAQSTIDLTRQLFIKNPNFEFQFAPDDELQAIRQMKQKQNRFQTGANLGVKMGFSHGWFQDYDWVIRINPDVLIRNSTWLANEAMPDDSVNGIFAKCSEKPERIHTDFFAFRPNALRKAAFSEMMVQPHTKNLYNHEFTAYKEFLPILRDGKALFLPGIAPSNGFCRLRGEDSPIYHGHESCRKRDKNQNEIPQVCDALEGWQIS